MASQNAPLSVTPALVAIICDEIAKVRNGEVTVRVRDGRVIFVGHQDGHDLSCLMKMLEVHS